MLHTKSRCGLATFIVVDPSLLTSLLLLGIHKPASERNRRFQLKTNFHRQSYTNHTDFLQMYLLSLSFLAYLVSQAKSLSWFMWTKAFPLLAPW